MDVGCTNGRGRGRERNVGTGGRLGGESEGCNRLQIGCVCSSGGGRRGEAGVRVGWRCATRRRQKRCQRSGNAGQQRFGRTCSCSSWNCERRTTRTRTWTYLDLWVVWRNAIADKAVRCPETVKYVHSQGRRGQVSVGHKRQQPRGHVERRWPAANDGELDWWWHSDFIFLCVHQCRRRSAPVHSSVRPRLISRSDTRSFSKKHSSGP